MFHWREFLQKPVHPQHRTTRCWITVSVDWYICNERIREQELRRVAVDRRSRQERRPAMNFSRRTSKLSTFIIFVALISVSALAFSQSPSPPAPGSQTAAAPPALRFAVRLIQVTVVAEDGDGRPVSDLKKEDFSL